MNILGIIPARYASTRLPGKPLADIHGKPMIQWVYERAARALAEVIVATDDRRIADAVTHFGGKAVITSADHNTGTNRCLEAYLNYQRENSSQVDVIINIQGDEPLLEPELLSQLSQSFLDPAVELATLATPVSDPLDLEDETLAFVIRDVHGDALYFSRSPLPHVRGVAKKHWLDHHNYLKHIGIYAYTPQALQTFAAMPLGSLERAESLEQDRWLESGRKIRVSLTEHQGISVDTPADLEKVRLILQAENKG